MTAPTLTAAPSVPLARVEWRVDGKPTGDASDTRCRFVPYLDARDIAELLDDWVGPANWCDHYEAGVIDGKPAMWCHLSIRVGDEWVTKTDVGVPSNFEGQKGAVSDAFKRAGCLKWGVGRNVYELPTLWAPCRVDQKGNAWPNERSLGSIRSQLRQAGLDDQGGRVSAGAPPDHTSDDAGAAAPESVTSKWRLRMDGIADDQARRALKSRFVSHFGKPDEIPASKAAEVDGWLDEQITGIEAAEAPF